MKITIHFSLIVLCFITSCGKTNVTINDLPPATQKGVNTFGCLVNGKAFINQKNIFFTRSSFDLSYVKSSHFIFSLSAFDTYNHPFKELYIVVNGTALHSGDKVSINSSIYDLNSNYDLNSIGAKYSIANEINPSVFVLSDYYTYPPNTGELDISLVDTIKKIISGTFSINATDTSGKNIVHITERRFDCKYQ